MPIDKNNFSSSSEEERTFRDPGRDSASGIHGHSHGAAAEISSGTGKKKKHKHGRSNAPGGAPPQGVQWLLHSTAGRITMGVLCVVVLGGCVFAVLHCRKKDEPPSNEPSTTTSPNEKTPNPDQESKDTAPPAPVKGHSGAVGGVNFLPGQGPGPPGTGKVTGGAGGGALSKKGPAGGGLAGVLISKLYLNSIIIN